MERLGAWIPLCGRLWASAPSLNDHASSLIGKEMRLVQQRDRINSQLLELRKRHDATKVPNARKELENSMKLALGQKRRIEKQLEDLRSQQNSFLAAETALEGMKDITEGVQIQKTLKTALQRERRKAPSIDEVERTRDDLQDTLEEVEELQGVLASGGAASSIPEKYREQPDDILSMVDAELEGFVSVPVSEPPTAYTYVTPPSMPALVSASSIPSSSSSSSSPYLAVPHPALSAVPYR